MKTTRILLSALATLSFVGISCQREEKIVEQPTGTIHMTLIASSDDETRSILQADGTTVLWGENEQLHVFETIDHAEGTHKDHKASSIGSSTDGGVTMAFGVDFDTFLTGQSYVYNAIYPNSAVVENDNDDPTSFKVITPSTQKATATSFDGDADLLLAEQVTKNQQPTSLQIGFKRMLVVGKMTLNNLASEANVQSVRFSSPNKKITGRSKMNLTTGEAVDYGYNSEDYVEVTYEDNIPANGLTVFFTCFPFQIAAGESFTVEVTTKDNKKFTKAVTIPENRSLSFELGKNTVFSVSMEGITPETVDNLAGKQYVILAKAAINYYYMSSTLSTTSTTYYLRGEPDPSVAADAQVDFTNSRTNFPNVTDFWEIEKYNDNYAIKSVTTGKYISWTSGNSAAQSANPYELTISAGSNGLYRVASKTATNRLLEYNAGSPRFAFYEDTQSDLYLIPVGPADSRIPLDEVTPTATQQGNTMNVIVSWSGVAHATSYTVALGSQSETLPSNTANQYQHTFTVAVFDTYEVTVTANPEEGYKESVATVSVTVEDKTPMITLNKSEINNVDADGWSAQTVEGVYTLNNFAADSDITVSVDGTVVTDVTLSEGSILLTVAENTDEDARCGSFSLTISGEEFTVQVNQKGTIDEPAPESFVITTQNLDLPTSGYDSKSNVTINGYSFAYTDLLKTNDNIQLKATPGHLENTTAIGQRIVSISFTTVKNSITVLAGSDASSLSPVTGEDGTYTFADNVKYFKITANGGYAIISEITVTYIPSSSGDETPVYATSVISFEDELSSYSDWTFSSIGTDNSSITAHDGSKYGANINDGGNGVSSASIKSATVIAKPYSVKFYISKTTSNTTASSWKVQVSSNGSSWTDVGEFDAKAMAKGVWQEKEVLLTSYENVYVRVYYNGSTAIRAIDDIELKYQTN